LVGIAFSVQFSYFSKCIALKSHQNIEKSWEIYSLSP
jgi:hypothetical protein